MLDFENSDLLLYCRKIIDCGFFSLKEYDAALEDVDAVLQAEEEEAAAVAAAAAAAAAAHNSKGDGEGGGGGGPHLPLSLSAAASASAALAVSSSNRSRALSVKADTLYQLGDFEHALVFYHRAGACSGSAREENK